MNSKLTKALDNPCWKIIVKKFPININISHGRYKMSVETEIALLKREVDDMKQIHVRLDSAIEKIAEVSRTIIYIQSWRFMKRS